MLRLKAVRMASCGLPFRSFAQPKLVHTPHLEGGGGCGGWGGAGVGGWGGGGGCNTRNG